MIWLHMQKIPSNLQKRNKQKNLDLVREFSKIIGHKVNINMQNLIVFLYTSNAHLDDEIENIVFKSTQLKKRENT